MMTSSYIHCINQCRACVGVHTQVEVECVVVRPYNDTSLIQLLALSDTPFDFTRSEDLKNAQPFSVDQAEGIL